MAEAEVKKPNDVPVTEKQKENRLRVNMILTEAHRLQLDRVGSYLLWTGEVKDRHYVTVCKYIVRSWLDKLTAQLIQEQMMREQQTLKDKTELEERERKISEAEAKLKAEKERQNAEKAAKALE